MMAARSHSINSAKLINIESLRKANASRALTLIEICFVEVVRSGNIHIVEACDLGSWA